MRNIFSSIIKSSIEHANGKIRASTGGFVFNPSKSLQEKTMKKNSSYRKWGLIKHLDATGKEMTLVSQQSFMCWNPEVCEGRYPKYNYPDNPDIHKWCVPAKVCRKCEHHIKASEHRYRFPACNYLKKLRGGNAGAIKGVQNIFKEAAENVKKILG